MLRMILYNLSCAEISSHPDRSFLPFDYWHKVEITFAFSSFLFECWRKVEIIFIFIFSLWLLGQSRDYFHFYLFPSTIGVKQRSFLFSFLPFDDWGKAKITLFFILFILLLGKSRDHLFFIIWFHLMIFNFIFMIISFLSIFTVLTSYDMIVLVLQGVITIPTFQHNFVTYFTTHFCFGMDWLWYDSVGIRRHYSYMYLWYN